MDGVLTASLDACRRDLDAHQAAVVARLGSAALGLLDLPDLDGGRVVPAQLRVTAVLYWASQVEEAGLPAFVERLAELVLNGRMHASIGSAGMRALGQYWRERRFRHSPADRLRIYSHLFGDAPGSTEPNTTFRPRMQVLVDAVLDAAERPGPASAARVATAALALGQDLSRRSAGATAWDADRILAHLREAVGLLRHGDIRGALGNQPPGGILHFFGPAVLGREVELGAGVARGTAGAELLRWIAANATAVEGGSVAVLSSDPVVAHAARWQAERPR